MTPMIEPRPETRARAALLGRYPSWAMASWTRLVFSELTRCLPVRTRDTVGTETPATRATSPMEGGRTSEGIDIVSSGSVSCLVGRVVVGAGEDPSGAAISLGLCRHTVGRSHFTAPL